MAHPIQHLVVLMMENRSFDHMLGFLPSTPENPINGLTGTETNPLSPEGPLVQVSRNARTVHDLIPDPGHEWVHVNKQIFGNHEGVGAPTMQGFVEDYADVATSHQGPNVMKCFTPETLPILSTLATQYAVCDRWFSSVPGSTIPNRLFTHGATSNGSLTQDVIYAPARLRTIFEEMDVPPNPYTYRIYTSGASVLLANLYLEQRQQRFHDIDDFAADAYYGDLPAYTFIEPSYDDDVRKGTYASSQHPDFPVDEGEAFIAKIYNALCKSPGWADTLFVIVYDEHGGIYDHVKPPNVARKPSSAGLPDVLASSDPPFAFDRLGVRVPAVFISPRIAPHTVINEADYEHSSIVATVRKLFCADQRPFNWREAQAPTFENLLVLDVPRPDVVLPNPFISADPTLVEIAAAAQVLAAIDAPVDLQAAGAAPVVIQASALPGTPPDVRSPSDLMLNMAKALDYSLRARKINPPQNISSIVTAQDAISYLTRAAATIRANSGGA